MKKWMRSTDEKALEKALMKKERKNLNLKTIARLVLITLLVPVKC